MAVERATGRHELVEVLLTLGRLQRTGILTVQGERELIGVSFVQGEIVSADALNTSLEEVLGEMLVSRKLLVAEQFAALLAEYEAGGGKVTDLLVERGFIDRQQLLEILRSHYYRVCRRALSWVLSECKFYEGREVAHEVGIRPLPVEELLVRSADDLGSAGPLPGVVPAPEALYRPTDSKPLAPGRDELLIGLATGDSDGASALLAAMDGRRSIDQLADRTGTSSFESRLTVYLLERAGQVERVAADQAERVAGIGAKAMSRLAGAATAVKRPLAGKRMEDGSRGQVSTGSSVTLADWPRWISRGLGAATIAVLAWTLVSDPGRVLLPFPWQEGLRQAVRSEQTSAAYLKIDRAAKTAFLLDGHFPETLEQLVLGSYLLPRDLTSPAGRPLGYASQVASYLLYPEHPDDPVPGASRTEAITGNFLLDPEFIPSSAVAQAPLVLLD